MNNGKISNLRNNYNKPQNLNLDIAKKIAANSNEKGRSRKNTDIVNKRKKIKSYSVIGILAALGISSTVLFGKNIKETYSENAQLLETAKQSTFAEYNLYEEESMAKFAKLIQETDNLLNSNNLSKDDKIKLNQNLLTIESNLSNIVDYTDTKIANLFYEATNRPTHVETVEDTLSITINKYQLQINEAEDTSSYVDKVYTFSNDLTNTLNFKDQDNLEIRTLKDLINNQINLGYIASGKKTYAPLEKTFKLVKKNLQDVNSIKDISIYIDKNGNIKENTKDLER